MLLRIRIRLLLVHRYVSIYGISVVKSIKGREVSTSLAAGMVSSSSIGSTAA